MFSNPSNIGIDPKGEHERYRWYVISDRIPSKRKKSKREDPYDGRVKDTIVSSIERESQDEKSNALCKEHSGTILASFFVRTSKHRSMSENRRLLRELREVAEDAGSGVSARPSGNDISKLQGKIRGPKDTPYEGGVFYVEIKVPQDYPFEPPKMRFLTKVWHPNVSSQTGAICLDILKDQWSPAMTLKTALLSVQALLSSPEPNDPQDAQVARQYLMNRLEFDNQAKNWTQTYAQSDVRTLEEKAYNVASILGIDASAARAALMKTEEDENAAIELLLR